MIKSGKIFGGEKSDEASSIIQSRDGGYLIVGETNSKGNGKKDAWIIKVDNNGILLWDKTFGGKKDDETVAAIETFGGGYLVVGTTNSKGNGEEDGWILKLDNEGNLLWDKVIGSSKLDKLFAVFQSGDSTYTVAGISQTGKTLVPRLSHLDKNGNLLSAHSISDANWAPVASCIQASDGGFVFSGSVRITTPLYELSRTRIIKLDKNYNIIWDNDLGALEHRIFTRSIIQKMDGEFVVICWWLKGDKMCHFFVTYDGNGNKLCEISTGPSQAFVSSLIQTNDGGFILAGQYVKPSVTAWEEQGVSFSLSGLGDDYASLFKYDNEFKLLSLQAFENREGVTSDIIHTADGGYALVGVTYFPNRDVWIQKLDSQCNVEW